MARLIATVLFTVAVLVAAPAVRANHDSGQGKSQDHLHGKGLDAGIPASALQVVAVPQPSSLLLLGLGAVATAVAALYTRRRSD